MFVRGRKHPCSIDKYWRGDPIESRLSPFTEWKTDICSIENCWRILRMTQMPGRLDLNSGFPSEYADNSKGFVSCQEWECQATNHETQREFQSDFFLKKMRTINWSILFSCFYWQTLPSGCLNEALTSVSLQVLYTGFIFTRTLIKWSFPPLPVSFKGFFP